MVRLCSLVAWIRASRQRVGYFVKRIPQRAVDATAPYVLQKKVGEILQNEAEILQEAAA